MMIETICYGKDDLHVCNWDTGSWMGGNTSGSKYMANNVVLDIVRVGQVEQLKEEPECRNAVTIALLIHYEKNLEHTTQYHGLLVYTDGGGILVGWITAETQRALDGGRYMTMLI